MGIRVDDVVGGLVTAVAGTSNRTRQNWCEYNESATIPSSYHPIYDKVGQGDIYQIGTKVKNIGYWNLMSDYLGYEGFKYAADAGGYTSNIINWNSANALPYNGEFASDTTYKRFIGGYTGFIDTLRRAVTDLGGVTILNSRLHSFDEEVESDKTVKIGCKFRDEAGTETPPLCSHLFLAMPKRSVELVGQTTADGSLGQKLQYPKTRLYVDSVIEQPSYKIGAAFKSAWWENCDFPPKLTGSTAGGKENWGPSITDLPLRQIYYMASPDTGHAMLASYDDMRFTSFWQEMELYLKETRTTAKSLDFQPLGTGGKMPDSMVYMVANQLTEVHYKPENRTTGCNKILESWSKSGTAAPYSYEGSYMGWYLDPFGAGYHAWVAHYDICDCMQYIRKPIDLATGVSHNVFLIGSAYSNDQAWVEGAFCTAESVLRDYLGVKTSIINNDPNYPLICNC